MSEPDTQPRIKMATEAQLADLLQGVSSELRQIFLDAHRLIIATLPDIVYTSDPEDGTTRYGLHQYGYNGWGMCALGTHASWVRVAFFRATDLDDPDGLLEGTGKKMRHVKLRSPEQAEQRRGALQALIRAAAALDVDAG